MDEREGFLTGVVDRAVGVQRNLKFTGLWAPVLVVTLRPM